MDNMNPIINFKDFCKNINSFDEFKIDDNLSQLNEENFKSFLKFNHYLANTLNDAINYNNYLRDCINDNLNDINTYLNLKYKNEFFEYKNYVELNKSKEEINSLFRKNKISNILDE